jgi:hypothetical protein
MYVVIVGLGLAGLWVAYQINMRGRLSFIRGHDNKQLPNAELIAGSFAAMAFLVGVAVLFFALAIPVYGVRWGTWHFYLGLIAGIGGIWRQIILARHTKLLALTRQSTGTQTTSSPLPQR